MRPILTRAGWNIGWSARAGSTTPLGNGYVSGSSFATRYVNPARRNTRGPRCMLTISTATRRTARGGTYALCVASATAASRSSGTALLADEGYLASAADSVPVGGAAADPRLNPLAPKKSHFPAKAKSVIWLFMNGGPSQVDTCDHNPEL